MREVYDSDLEVQIVMSYANLGTLKSIQSSGQSRLTEDELKPIMMQFLHAVADIHSKNIIHRDIKPDNVLLKSSNKVEHNRKVCLADFGIACLATDDASTTQLCGTPGFLDPFMLNPPEVPETSLMTTTLRATLKTDIFGVGSVFFGLVAGKPLITGECI